MFNKNLEVYITFHSLKYLILLAIIQDLKFYVVTKLYIPRVFFLNSMLSRKPVATICHSENISSLSIFQQTLLQSLQLNSIQMLFSLQKLSPFTYKHWKSLKSRMFHKLTLLFKELCFTTLEIDAKAVALRWGLFCPHRNILHLPEDSFVVTVESGNKKWCY